jgi:hypothetical protein
MAAGARSLTTMSAAALSLFDALGVLGRAAIPLTSWILQQVAAGSRWLDMWLHAKDATGQLDRSMREAQSSLALVAKLVESVGRAVGALGEALYPVSKVAVKDLTDGLNALAGIIDRNQDAIRDVVGGALGAFVAVVRLAAKLVGELWPALDKTADSLGGWKRVFEGLIALKIALIVGGWADAFLGLKTQAREAGVAIGAEGAASGLAGRLAALKKIGVIGITLAIATQFLPQGQGQPGWMSKVPIFGDAAGFGYWLGQQITGRAGGGVATPSAAQDARLKAKVAADMGTGATWGAPAGLGSHGRTYTVNPGVDMRDENAMIPIALNALAQAGYDVRVTSGYRTYKKQAGLYDRYVKSGFNIRYIAAKPGTSNHETGNAADVYVNGMPVDQSPGALAILKKYGLVADVKGDHEHLDYIGAGGVTPPPKTSPFSTQPAWTKNTGLTAAQRKALAAKKAAEALAQSLAGLRRQITGQSTTISDDFSHGLLSDSHAADLSTRVLHLFDSLEGAPKKAIPGIRSNIAALKAQLRTDLKLDAENKQLGSEVAQLGQAVSLGLFPPAVLKRARAAANAAGVAIADGTDAGAQAAKASLAKLAALVKTGVADATAVREWQQKLHDLGVQLRSQFTQTLGRPDVYATPAALQAAQTAAESIIGRIRQGLTGAALTAAKTQLDKQLQTIQSGLEGMLNMLDLSKGRYESGWARLAQAGSDAFDRVTQQGIAAAQTGLQAAIDRLQITVKSAYGDFLYGDTITKTPAEQQLATLQNASKRAQLEKAVADARKNVDKAKGASLIFDMATGVTSVRADAQEVLDAQEELARALQALQEDDLQTRADAERKSADDQLQIARNARQREGDVFIAGYEQQRALQKQALDDQVGALQTAFEQGDITAQSAFDRMTQLYASNGVTISELSVTIAGSIYTGVATWTSPIMTLMDDLQTKIDETRAAITAATGVMVPASGLPLDQIPGATAALAGTYGSPAAGHYISGGGSTYYRSLVGPYGYKPQLAQGGVVRARPGGVDVTVGEGGEDEVIAPLSKLGGDVHLHFHGPVLGTPEELALELIPMIRQELLRNGRRNGRLGSV